MLCPSVRAQQSSDAIEADSIMKRVFSYVEREKLGGVQYASDVYLRYHSKTKRKGPVVRYIPGMVRLERGKREYMGEARLRFQYRPPGEVDCKVLAFYTTQRYLPAQRMTSLRRFNFSVYEPNLFTDRILNPLHRRNKRFYRYRFEYASYCDTFKVYRLNVTPRFNNDRLVQGVIDVDVNTGGIRNFNFSFRYHLKRIRLSGRMGECGYESLLPSTTRIVSDFTLLGNHVREIYESFSKHSFTCPLDTVASQSNQGNLDLTDLCLLRIDTAKVITERTYFNDLRPIPLRDDERRILQQYDSLRLQQSIEKVLTPKLDSAQSTVKAIFNPQTEDLLLDSHTLRWSTRATNGSLRLPPIITPSMAQWSGSKGFSLQTRIDFSYRFKHDIELRMQPRVGYSFKQKQVYWRVPLTFTFLPRYDGSLSAEAGGGNMLYSSRQADEVRDKLDGITAYDSLLSVLNAFGFDYYRDNYLNTNISITPIPGMRLAVGSRFHRRVLTNWNKLANGVGIHQALSSVAPRLYVEWTPRQYYYREGLRRRPLYSRYPTFILDCEKGYALGRGDTKYERFEFDVRYRLPLYALRSLYFRWGGGFYSSRGDDCFIDYDYFRFNNMPDGWRDDFMGEFQLLDSRWYNESRYYFRASSMYESPMLLFSRIKFLTRVIQNERVYLNVLSVKSLNAYSELGYGICTHFFDAGCFMSIASDKSIGFGVKAVLKFFED